MISLVKRKLAGACTRYLRYYDDYSYDFNKNGEAALIDRIAQIKPLTVFDVGANVGNWSLCAANSFGSDCTVHSFEMVPSTYQKLVQATSGLKVIAVNSAMAEIDGEIEFKRFAGHDSLNTTVLRPKVWESSVTVTTETAKCVSGDSYCNRNGIEHIDFLKIDVEGAEQAVLRGFRERLNRRSIRLIQFEYGYANGDEHFLMRDFFDFFKVYGYKVAKLRRKGIKFGPYKREYNNFTSGPNFIAIRDDDAELEHILAS